MSRGLPRLLLGLGVGLQLGADLVGFGLGAPCPLACGAQLLGLALNGGVFAVDRLLQALPFGPAGDQFIP